MHPCSSSLISIQPVKAIIGCDSRPSLLTVKLPVVPLMPAHRPSVLIAHSNTTLTQYSGTDQVTREGFNLPGLSPVLKVVFGDKGSLLSGSVPKIYPCFQHLVFSEEELSPLQTKGLIGFCKVNFLHRWVHHLCYSGLSSGLLCNFPKLGLNERSGNICYLYLQGDTFDQTVFSQKTAHTTTHSLLKKTVRKHTTSEQ